MLSTHCGLKWCFRSCRLHRDPQKDAVRRLYPKVCKETPQHADEYTWWSLSCIKDDFSTSVSA